MKLQGSQGFSAQRSCFRNQRSLQTSLCGGGRARVGIFPRGERGGPGAYILGMVRTLLPCCPTLTLATETECAALKHSASVSPPVKWEHWARQGAWHQHAPHGPTWHR